MGNGTNVSGYSDTDYFAGIPTSNLKDNSLLTLRQIKEDMQARFPSTTNIHIDNPAVVIPFGTAPSETTEIIPVDFVRTENGYNVYDIPDSNGGWMKSSPLAHNAYVSEHNKRLGYELKPLIRFIKAWKFYNNVPVSSFYLEMRTAKYASTETSILYSIDIRKVFKHLHDVQLARMDTPAGIVGSVTACKSDANYADALSKLSTALSRANKAREAEEAGKISDAFYWWNLLFNDQFPSYYL